MQPVRSAHTRPCPGRARSSLWREGRFGVGWCHVHSETSGSNTANKTIVRWKRCQVSNPAFSVSRGSWSVLTVCSPGLLGPRCPPGVRPGRALRAAVRPGPQTHSWSPRTLVWPPLSVCPGPGPGPASPTSWSGQVGASALRGWSPPAHRACRQPCGPPRPHRPRPHHTPGSRTCLCPHRPFLSMPSTCPVCALPRLRVDPTDTEAASSQGIFVCRQSCPYRLGWFWAKRRCLINISWVLIPFRACSCSLLGTQIS